MRLYGDLLFIKAATSALQIIQPPYVRPHQQFMPVTTVPDITTNTLQDRRPKDSLDTFELNFNIQNALEEIIIAPTTRASTPISPVTQSRRVNEISQSQTPEEDK